MSAFDENWLWTYCQENIYFLLIISYRQITMVTAKVWSAKGEYDGEPTLEDYVLTEETLPPLKDNGNFSTIFKTQYKYGCSSSFKCY